MLVCPQCERLNPGLEDSGELYQQNDQYVTLVSHDRGKAIRFNLPQSVGNNQGVRMVSDLIKAERSAGYEISFNAISEASHLRVFVEGFRLKPDDQEAAKWVKSLPSKANPWGQGTRLKRVFRKQVNAGKPVDWTCFSAQFIPPSRNQFDYMFVNLYAYLPGKAAYDSVVLRKLTKSEIRALRKDGGSSGRKGSR
jgi:hypothetical protein